MGSQQQGPDLELVIKEMQRQIRELQTSSRVPQVTGLGGTKTQFSQNPSLTEYTRTATGWGELDGPPPPIEVNIKVPESGRVLFIWGCFGGVWTTTAGGNNERLGMGCRVGTTGVGGSIYSGSDTAPAMLIDELASHKIYASITAMKVVATMPPRATCNGTIEYYRHNASSFGVFVNNPWLMALPI